MKERVYDKRPYRARDWKRTGNERIWKEKKKYLALVPGATYLRKMSSNLWRGDETI